MQLHNLSQEFADIPEHHAKGTRQKGIKQEQERRKKKKGPTVHPPRVNKIRSLNAEQNILYTRAAP
jgi:hypothetical protein